MRVLRVHDSIGSVLGHDLTRIVPGEFKGPAFKKGHVIRVEDVPELLRLGREHIHVLEPSPGMVHEDEAALRIARAAAGPGVEISTPSEGKVNLTATVRGLLTVAVDRLLALNDCDQVVFATRHTQSPVAPRDLLAGTRILPLEVPTAVVELAERICAEDGPLVEVKPYKTVSAGLVVTGNEVYYGRIQDRFIPVVRDKLASYGVSLAKPVIVPDDRTGIAAQIRGFAETGAGLIAVTGGMSVDPDDVTPSAIRAAAGNVVTYGTPVLPGSMFMLAYIGDIPVLGLPGCVLHANMTVLDLILPRLLAGVTVSRSDIVALAHGGMCLGCEVCHAPACPFGKC